MFSSFVSLIRGGLLSSLLLLISVEISFYLSLLLPWGADFDVSSFLPPFFSCLRVVWVGIMFRGPVIWWYVWAN
jgi:hypothetical protein